MLHTLPAGFVRCVHIDGGHQFPQSVAVQLIDAHILVRRLNELLNVFVLSFLYFNFLSQSYALGLQLLLLRFIGQAQHIEALITQPSAGVVLVNPDEQPFQFSDAVFVPFQPFPSDADLLTAFQPELFLHHCTEMCLMPQNVARHSLNVFQDYVAEYGFPDVMSTALVLVLLMERTVKERALRSVIVRRPVIQLLTAVGTVHQPGKDAASACTGLAMPLLAHLLYLLKHGFLDDGLMCIGEDGLLLKGIVPLLLVLDGVGIGLEVHRTARVLPPFQNRHNGTAVPVAGVLRFLVWGLDALQGPVCAGR